MTQSAPAQSQLETVSSPEDKQGGVGLWYVPPVVESDQQPALHLKQEALHPVPNLVTSGIPEQVIHSFFEQLETINSAIISYDHLRPDEYSFESFDWVLSKLHEAAPKLANDFPLPAFQNLLPEIVKVEEKRTLQKQEVEKLEASKNLADNNKDIKAAVDYANQKEQTFKSYKDEIAKIIFSLISLLRQIYNPMFYYPQLNFGAVQLWGKKPTQEDQFTIFPLNLAALPQQNITILVQQLMRHSAQMVNEEARVFYLSEDQKRFDRRYDSGTTFAQAIICGNTIIAANAGDTTIRLQYHGAQKFSNLTPKLHNPGPNAPDPIGKNEFNANVAKGKKPPLMNPSETQKLRVYKSIGDNEFESTGKNCQLDCSQENLVFSESKDITQADLILATDGLDEGLSKAGIKFEDVVARQPELPPFQIAQNLAQGSLRHSNDNISVAVLRLTKDNLPPPEQALAIMMVDGHGGDIIAGLTRRRIPIILQKSIGLLGTELTSYQEYQKKYQKQPEFVSTLQNEYTQLSGPLGGYKDSDEKRALDKRYPTISKFDLYTTTWKYYRLAAFVATIIFALLIALISIPLPFITTTAVATAISVLFGGATLWGGMELLNHYFSSSAAKITFGIGLLIAIAAFTLFALATFGLGPLAVIGAVLAAEAIQLAVSIFTAAFAFFVAYIGYRLNRNDYKVHEDAYVIEKNLACVANEPPRLEPSSKPLAAVSKESKAEDERERKDSVSTSSNNEEDLSEKQEPSTSSAIVMEDSKAIPSTTRTPSTSVSISATPASSVTESSDTAANVESKQQAAQPLTPQQQLENIKLQIWDLVDDCAQAEYKAGAECTAGSTREAFMVYVKLVGRMVRGDTDDNLNNDITLARFMLETRLNNILPKTNIDSWTELYLRATHELTFSNANSVSPKIFPLCRKAGINPPDAAQTHTTQTILGTLDRHQNRSSQTEPSNLVSAQPENATNSKTMTSKHVDLKTGKEDTVTMTPVEPGMGVGLPHS